MLQLYALNATTSLAIVQSVGSYSFQALYNDPSQNILVATSTTSGTMTVAVCASTCAGYTYFGLENGVYSDPSSVFSS